MFSMLTILDLLTFTKSNTTQTDGKSNGIRMFDGRGRLDAFIVKRGVSTTFWPQEGHPRGHFLMFYLPPGTYKREVSQHQNTLLKKLMCSSPRAWMQMHGLTAGKSLLLGPDFAHR